MFKIGGKVYFLVEQKDGDVTLEDGEIISYDEEIICMTTCVGGDRNKIRFLKREYAFSNAEDGIKVHGNLHEEFLKIKRATPRLHISLFEEKS